jgi:hypothetical protein
MSLKDHLWSFKIILKEHTKPASVGGYSARPRRRRRRMKPARPGPGDSAELWHPRGATRACPGLCALLLLLLGEGRRAPCRAFQRADADGLEQS